MHRDSHNPLKGSLKELLYHAASEGIPSTGHYLSWQFQGKPGLSKLLLDQGAVVDDAS
jgi:hypothetical protein